MGNVTDIELIGGGMRVPVIQSELKKALGDMELGMHINADESMALGASFHGANVSTAFRVRHVGLTDINPFPITITVKDLAVEGEEETKGGFFLVVERKRKRTRTRPTMMARTNRGASTPRFSNRAEDWVSRKRLPSRTTEMFIVPWITKTPKKFPKEPTLQSSNTISLVFLSSPPKWKKRA